MKMNTCVGNVDIKLDTSRIEGNIKEAQKLLNMQIVEDCEPLIPFQQGALRKSVNYPEGIYGGMMEYNTPYVHYQYMGEVYGPNIPIYDDEILKGFRSPPKKYSTGRKMVHTEHPETTDHWFEEAKRQHGKEWIDLVKKVVGKG